MVVRESNLVQVLADIGKVIKSSVIPDLESVYLFGSALDESQFNAYSDIDIALFAPSLFYHVRDRIYRLRKCLIDAGYPRELIVKIEFLLIPSKKNETRSGFVKSEIMNRGVELST